MEEFNSTEAEVLETEVDSGEQTDAVDSSEENHDFDMVDDNGEPVEETEEKSHGGKADPVSQQSAEDNHAAKLARLKAERDAKKLAEQTSKDIDRQIRESGAINPYTDKPFATMQEFLDYGKKVREAEQKSRAENEGKTIEEIEEEDEVRKEIAQRKTKEESKTETTAGDKAREDLIEIMENHPDVDVDVLLKNEKFRKFCGSRFGVESLNSLYEDYADLVHEAERSAKADTRASRTTGSGSNGGERLTASQRRALDEWNESNPDMKMTPAEFLHR